MTFAKPLSGSELALLKAAVAADGFAAFGPPAIDDATLTAMRTEADYQKAKGWGRTNSKAVDHRCWRANLGPVARSFLTMGETIQLMSEVVGVDVIPRFEATCITYYEGPLDFLGVHHDRPQICSYTLILYLAAVWPSTGAPGPGLELHIFAPDDEAGTMPIRRIATRENMLVIGRGADVLHSRPVLREGESVVALTACFAESPTCKIAGEKDTSAVAILIEEGFAEWQQGNLAQAEQRFAAALQRDRTHAQAWSGLGSVKWSAGAFAEALDMFMAAARCDGSAASIWSNIGLCLRELKAFGRAQNAFAVALMIDPGYAPALNEWGNVLQDQGRSRESVEYYTRALALDSTRVVVHHNLGVAYERLNEPMLATQAFSAALDRDPGYVHSLEELGALCARGGLVEAARDFFTRAGTPRAAALAEAYLCAKA
jgi:Tfp pilus assembly protein PilF